MANICENIITVVGLKEDPETFVRALSKAMFQIDLGNLDPKQWGEGPAIDGKAWYRSLVEQHRQKGFYPLTCILYPHRPYTRLGVTAPRFYCATRWEPPQDELKKASKLFPDLTFHLSGWLEPDGPTVEFVIRHGDIVEGVCRLASWYLFDSLQYPAVALLPAHLPYTLAQRGSLRIEDAINIIEDLRAVLDDVKFLTSPHTPFSECRDKQKTEKLRLGLVALHDSMVDQAKQLDFNGVFLEQQELSERYPVVVESDKALMQTLGLEPLLPAKGKAVRFSLLPFQVALTEDPHRVVSPVLHYTNADPISGKYQECADGTTPPIAWELRYVCLTPSDVMQIRRLPDADKTPFDIDLVMTNASDRGFGHEIYRISNKARWRLDAELVKEVEQKAIEMSSDFAAKIANRTDVTIFADFRAVEAALFPETVK